MSLSRTATLTAILVLSTCHLIWSQQRWNPLWYDFNNAVVVRTYYGDVRGFSVPWDIEDTVWHRELHEYPPWYLRRVNCFLGVPFALPPLGYLRFQRPKKPRWYGTWEANFFRPACPQKIDRLLEDIPDYPKANISEDCLYMNIYAPNVTTHSASTLYPVMVWIHGGNFTSGSAQQIPGQMLATREVVVVTFNYRLGALGFLSTENEYAAGNWGLWDQQMALEFVKENIKGFRGDPSQITLCGEGSGAASVGMHLVSPISRGKGFYHQAIMMSGNDLSSFAYIRPAWRPREYAARLGKLLDCPTFHSYDLVQCLQDSNKHTWQEFVDTQDLVMPHDGVLGAVWAPVQDSTYLTKLSFLPETPYEYRRSHEFEKVPLIIGLNTEDGTQKANDTVHGLQGGMLPQTFETYVKRMISDWLVQDVYQGRAYEAIEFQYTYWPDPENATARTQEFINLLTDLQLGVGMDQVIKVHSLYQPTYVYQFNYKSWNDWLPRWMGVSYSAALPYVFGFPYINETVVNETGLIPRQYFDYEDRNISDWMMYLFTNFAKYGEPTPNNTWNVTWGPFNEYNLSYLIVDWYPHLGLRYRQSKYGFWSDYFPTISLRNQYTPTATPTASGYEYVVATGSMSSVVIVLFIILFILIYALVVHPGRLTPQNSFYDDVPVSFSRSQSTIVLSKSSTSIPQHSVA